MARVIVVPNLSEIRRREKQASRDEDARRLAAGEVTPEELAEENSFIRGRDWVIDYEHVKHPGKR